MRGGESRANNDTLLLGSAERCNASKWHHDHPHDTILYMQWCSNYRQLRHS